MNLLKLQLDKNRIFGLDIVRAFAILFVVIEHGGNFLPEKVSNYQRYFLLDGVSIFFVLSGFLIGGILIKTLNNEDASFKTLFNFWKRRWIRTLPNYFLVLSLLSLISCFTIIGAKAEGLYQYVFFIQNFNTVHPNFFPEAWSLSVEEWFYLLIPTALFILVATKQIKIKQAILFLVTFTIVATIVFRYYRYSTINVTVFDDWDTLFRKQVITRLDSIMFGVLAAYLYHYHQAVWDKRKDIAFIAGIIIIVFQKILSVSQVYTLGVYDCVFSFSVNAFAIMLLLPFFNGIKSGKGFAFKTLTYTSLISYSMYLLNLSFVQLWIIEKPNWFNLEGSMLILVKYTLYWFFTIIGSILLYKYYELPLMRYRDKITKKDSRMEINSEDRIIQKHKL